MKKEEIEELKSHFRKNALLSSSGNKKMEMNEIPTYNLSLLPHSLNSKRENLCTHSTKECRETCLNLSGRGGFNQVQEARRRRTEFFVNIKPVFMTTLISELSRINSLYDQVLVRLNTFTDVDWNTEMNKLGFDMAMFSNIIFYGYTKVPERFNNLAENEELVFSYSGKNWKQCEDILNNKKGNVAVVFGKGIPETYKGYKVLPGDDSDMRLSSIEGTGNIIGLKFKKAKGVKTNLENSKFVITDYA